MPRIAIVIPTYNRQENWEKYIDVANLPNVDIYLMDNSTKQSRNVYSSFNYQYVGTGIGKQRALDLWNPIKDYDFVIEIDDDFNIDINMFKNSLCQFKMNQFYYSDIHYLNGDIIGNDGPDIMDYSKYYYVDLKKGDKVFIIPFKEYAKYSYDVPPGEKFISEESKWVRMFNGVKLNKIQSFVSKTYDNDGYTKSGVPASPLATAKNNLAVLKYGRPKLLYKMVLLYDTYRNGKQYNVEYQKSFLIIPGFFLRKILNVKKKMIKEKYR